MKGFDKKYWDENYNEPQTMDGIYNAKQHVRYAKALFSLEQIDISSIVDLGFGYGHLLKEFMRVFLPHKVVGIEPSAHVFEKGKKRCEPTVTSMQVNCYQEDLLSWCQKKRKGEISFDLGICTSVMQYISTNDLKTIIPVLSKRIKYLYLTIPTDIELDRQKSEISFFDQYAIRRTQKEYHSLLKEDFAMVSSRLYESRYFFNDEDTFFTDLLYRV